MNTQTADEYLADSCGKINTATITPLPEPKCPQCGRTCEHCPFFFAERMNQMQKFVDGPKRGPLGWFYDEINPKKGNQP